MKSHIDGTKIDKDESMKSTFSINLRKAREESGMTQIGLAKRLFMSNKTLSNWENKGVEPNLDTIVKLAEILDTTCDYLLTGTKPDRVNASRKYGLSNDALHVLENLNSIMGIYMDGLRKDHMEYIRPIAFINAILTSDLLREMAEDSITYMAETIRNKQSKKEQVDSKSDFDINQVFQTWKDQETIEIILKHNQAFKDKKVVSYHDYLVSKRYNLNEIWRKILNHALLDACLVQDGILISNKYEPTWVGLPPENNEDREEGICRAVKLQELLTGRERSDSVPMDDGKQDTL